MGNHWGSIHLRTEDREAVRAALEALAAERGVKFLLSPMANGWVGVFPHENGQDFSVGDALAARTGLPAFHLINHDDSIFAYRFYRGGAVVDQYVSTPGYFSDDDAVAEEKLVGNPELYADLLRQPVAKAAAVLRRDGDDAFAFAGERMIAFGKLLGLSSVANAYEYLREGERFGVKGWRQFVHVPADTEQKERDADAAAAAAQDAQEADLRRRGLLLATYTPKKGHWPVWCADHAGGGFLLNWSKVPGDTAGPVERIGPPWRRKGEPLPFQPGGVLNSLATDRAGRFVGVSTWKTFKLRDAAGGALVREIPEAAGSLQQRFSADGRFLLCLARDQAMLLSTADGAILATADSGGGQNCALAPDGSAMLIDRQLDVLLVPLDERGNRGGVDHPLYIGGPHPLAGMMAGNLHAALSKIDPDEFLARAEKQMEKSLKAVEAMFAKHKGKKGVPEFAVEAARKQMKQQMAEQAQRFRDAAAGKIPPPQRQAAERVSTLAFSFDGTLLFCATHQGLRVYEWSQVLAATGSAGGNLLNPKFAFSTAPPAAPGTEWRQAPAYVYAVAQDPAAPQRLLFGGMDGQLRALDLPSGQVASLAELPGPAAIISLGFSGDGSALLAAGQPDLREIAGGGRRRRNANVVNLHVFNAAALRRV